MEIRINKSAITQYLLIYLMFIIPGSCLFAKYWTGTMKYFVLLIIYAALIAFKKKYQSRYSICFLLLLLLNDMYLKDNLLNVELLNRGFAWLDTGTMESLLRASDFIHMVEEQQGVMISAPEEIAYRYKWITTEQLKEAAALYGKSPYGEHLKTVVEGKMR